MKLTTYLLELLAENGAIGQTDLGLALGTDPGVLVTLLNPLEDDGLIARERDRAQRQAEEQLAVLKPRQVEQLRRLLVVLTTARTRRIGGGRRPDL